MESLASVLRGIVRRPAPMDEWFPLYWRVRLAFEDLPHVRVSAWTTHATVICQVEEESPPGGEGWGGARTIVSREEVTLAAEWLLKDIADDLRESFDDLFDPPLLPARRYPLVTDRPGWIGPVVRP